MLWWTLFLMLTVAAEALAVPGIVPDGFNSEGSIKHRGRYYNPNYCFSVVIPDGIVGKSDPPPNPRHGFGAQLDTAGNSYLYVGADYGAEIDPPLTAEKVLLRYSQSRQTAPTRLGVLRALRTVRRYSCAGTQCVEDAIVAVSGDRVFEMRLLSTADRYEQGAKTLERVRESWKLQPCR